MKFWEAMKAIEEGKKVKSKYWDSDEFIHIEDGKIIDQLGDEFGVIYIDDNWEIYVEKKEVDARFKEFYHYLKDENGFTNGQYGEFIYNRNEKDHLLEFYRQLLEMAKYYKLD